MGQLHLISGYNVSLKQVEKSSFLWIRWICLHVFTKLCSAQYDFKLFDVEYFIEYPCLKALAP